MTEPQNGRSEFGRENGSTGEQPNVEQPNVDELRDWLVKVGDVRPPVEPDLHAIVDRAGQRVFRRRIGTGLALLGLIVPGMSLAPTVAASFTSEPTIVSDCIVAEAGRSASNFGTCRYQ